MVFQTVIVGIDGTRQSYEAARQGARLTQPGGTLRLVAAADPFSAVLNRWGPGRLVEPGEVDDGHVHPLAVERLPVRARETLAAVRATLPGDLDVVEQVVEGRAWEVLRDLAATEGAGLIVVGSHGDGRITGVIRASTATELLHDAPCSVLVSRSAFDASRFPARLVVGADGSENSLAAIDVATAIAAGDDGVEAMVLVVPKAGVEVGVVERAARPLPVTARGGRPVEALVEAAGSADLVVLGARGLSGLRALGSVSERVAHRAESSVLVVRTG